MSCKPRIVTNKGKRCAVCLLTMVGNGNLLCLQMRKGWAKPYGNGVAIGLQKARNI